jgi:CHAD domain-containing protein
VEARREGAAGNARPARDLIHIAEAITAKWCVAICPIALSRKLTTEAAFKSVARACLHHLIANVPVLRAGNPEGLHQVRVSLRRLRAAISLFSGILHDGQTETIKRELTWLTGELGQARELDVFMKKVTQAPNKTKHRNKGLARLKDDLTSQRKDAFERAQSALARYGIGP